MRTFEDILHPVTPAQFRAEHQDRAPLHIPAEAGSDKHRLLSWTDFNAVLNQAGLWDSDRLQVMRDQAPVPPELYCRLKQTPHGPVWRPRPDAVQALIADGASILANDMLTRTPAVHQAGVALGQAFAAEVGASVFCSFRGVPVIRTHYDLHEVFAVQTEGEKVWNLYEGRADTPIDYPDGATQDHFDRGSGRLIGTVHMKPGDVLYMPRGVYHDAVAQDQPSLHVSFTVMPLTGRAILSLLDALAVRDPAFRIWLPSAEADGGEALGARLAMLGEALARVAVSPEMRGEVAMLQRRLIPRAPMIDLPEPRPLTHYRTAGRAFPPTSIARRRAYDWMISRRRFSVEDMLAQLDFLSEDEARAALDEAEKAGAVQKA